MCNLRAIVQSVKKCVLPALAGAVRGGGDFEAAAQTVVELVQRGALSDEALLQLSRGALQFPQFFSKQLQGNVVIWVVNVLAVDVSANYCINISLPPPPE